MRKPPLPAHKDEPGVVLAFKNSGQTPAYRYVSWAQIAVIEPESADKNLIVPHPVRMYSPATVGAGGLISKSLWFGRPLTAQEIADVGIGKKCIFVYGRLEYRDAFRRKRWANFRLHYAGIFPPLADIQFNFSDRGNESN
jgi:hypothetical protein